MGKVKEKVSNRYGKEDYKERGPCTQVKSTLLSFVSDLLVGDVGKVALSPDIPYHRPDKGKGEGDRNQVIDERGIIRGKCVKECVSDRGRIYICHTKDRPDGYQPACTGMRLKPMLS